MLLASPGNRSRQGADAAQGRLLRAGHLGLHGGPEAGAGEEGAAVLPRQPRHRRPVRDRPLLHRGRAAVRQPRARRTAAHIARQTTSSTACGPSAGPRSRTRWPGHWRCGRAAGVRGGAAAVHGDLPHRRPADDRRDPARIRLVDSVRPAAGASTRIFSFGIGTDVNTHLLDRIASETRAVSQYVLPKEDIEVKVSSFYSKIRDPVLSDLSLSFTNPSIRVTQLLPVDAPGPLQRRHAGRVRALLRVGRGGGEDHRHLQRETARVRRGRQLSRAGRAGIPSSPACGPRAAWGGCWTRCACTASPRS